MSYKITTKCELCGACKAECPQGAIKEGAPYQIDDDNCIQCGACEVVCPARAVITVND